MFRIDARTSREFRAVVFALAQADKTIQKQVRKAAKDSIQPEWSAALAKNASSLMESRVLVATGRATLSNQNVKLSSATVGRSLSGGLPIKTGFAGVEYGADTTKRSTYKATSKKGNRYDVTRRTRAQFKPRSRSGYVFGPAAATVVPRIFSLWAQTVVRTFHEALEGKS